MTKLIQLVMLVLAFIWLCSLTNIIEHRGQQPAASSVPRPAVQSRS